MTGQLGLQATFQNGLDHRREEPRVQSTRSDLGALSVAVDGEAVELVDSTVVAYEIGN
jgi:hypothetical protein